MVAARWVRASFRRIVLRRTLLMLFGMVLAVAGTAASSVDTDTPPPILTATPSQMDSKAPAFLANGVLGVRVPPNPLLAGSGPEMDGGGSALVMGFYKVMGGTIGNQPSPAPAPYPFETDLSVENVSMRQHPELVTVHQQSLNTSCGELVTELTFACTNCSKTFSVDIVATVYLSRKIPALAVMNVSMTCTPTDVNVQIGPNLATPGSFGPNPDPDPVIVDVPSLSTWKNTAGFPPFAKADVTLEALLGLRHASRFGQEQSSLGVAVSVMRRSSLATAGHLDYFVSTAMLSSRYSSRPIEQSIRIALTGLSADLDRAGSMQPVASQHTPERLQQENRQEWAELWKGRVRLHGPGVTDTDQRVIDLAFFYQHAAVHRSTLDGSACCKSDSSLTMHQYAS